MESDSLESEELDELLNDVILYTVNFFVGCICMVTVILNIFILVITTKFRTQFKVSLLS